MASRADTTSNLILGTSLSSILLLDIRTMRTLQTFSNPLPFGPITCLCIDRKRVWLVVGTATGTLTLWDLRFGLLLRSWSVGKGRVHQIAVHPCRGKGRWIVVAMEEEEGEQGKTAGALVAEVWDVDRGVRAEEYRAVHPGSSASSSSSRPSEPTSTAAMQDATLDPAAAIEALLAASTATPPKQRIRLGLPSSTDSPSAPSVAPRATRPGVRAFLVGVDYSMQSDAGRPSTFASGDLTEGAQGKKDGGYLITGGEDRKLRFWDLGRVGKSAVVSGLEMEDDQPTFR